MTAEDWYNEWAFGIKIEWKDLSEETRKFWEDNFKLINASNPNGEELRQENQ